MEPFIDATCQAAIWLKSSLTAFSGYPTVSSLVHRRLLVWVRRATSQDSYVPLKRKDSKMRNTALVLASMVTAVLLAYSAAVRERLNA